MSRRITRNSYKRKVILVGIMLFMAIALISTGFAAWVISTGASQNHEGGVEVGVVTGVDLKMELSFSTGSKSLYLHDANPNDDEGPKLYYTKAEGEQTVADTTKPFAFHFEPEETDGEGRVRYQENDPYEVLSLTIAGTVTPGEYVSDVVIKLTLPAGVVNAIDENYITFNGDLEKQFDEDGKLTGGIVTLTLKDGNGLEVVTQPDSSSPVDPKTYKFSKTLEFGWGSEFENMNPCLYYDETAAGKDVLTDEVIVALKRLRAVIYGYDGEEGFLDYSEDELQRKKAPTYQLSISANIN